MDLMKLYDECVNGLKNETQAFYSRHTRDSQLTETRVSKLLTEKEYSIWKKSLEGYLEELEGQGEDSRLTSELNTLATKSQVSRKEQLLTNVYHNMSYLAGQSETELTGLLEGLVQISYERKILDIQSTGGATQDVSKVDEWLLKQILSYPWSEKQYPEALWDNTDQLAALICRGLTLGFMSGADMNKAAEGIDDVMRKGRYTVQRLVWTEASCFANQGQLLAYQDAGMTKHRFLGGGCEICQRLNGQMLKLSNVRIEGNLPPIHSNYKCTTVVAYDIPILKQRQGNSLGSNPKLEE